MKRHLTLPAVAIVVLALSGGATAIAAPAGTWTPEPVKGFSGSLQADQPKMDGSATGAVTAAWFGSLPEPFTTPGNVLVSSYNGTSWGCPIQLVGTTPAVHGVPPAFDVGADGTVAVAGDEWIPEITLPLPPTQDVVVHVRRPGQTAFTSAGTGVGYPVRDDAVVATSAVRTVVAWISGDALVGAELLPGATSATPVVLATGQDLAFAKLRMDAQGNAVIVYRSATDALSVVQNWLIWPAGQAPGASQTFAVSAPDDFVETKALSVSNGGRMIIAMYDGATENKNNEVVVFTGTTTTGFTGRTPLLTGDPLPATDFGTAIDDTGHATVAFRMDDIGGADAKAWIYVVDPASGAAVSSGSFTESGETGIAIFKVLQSGATAYVAWTDSNFTALGPSGVVSFSGGPVNSEMRTSETDWLGLAQGPRGPAAYWPRQSLPDDWDGPFVSTLAHKPLDAKLTNTRISVSKRTGAITVTGKVTPAPAAQACAGAAVHVQAINKDRFKPSSAAQDVTIRADGTYSWRLTRSSLKGCKKVDVATFLQSPDSKTPISVKRTVTCSG